MPGEGSVPERVRFNVAEPPAGMGRLSGLTVRCAVVSAARRVIETGNVWADEPVLPIWIDCVSGKLVALNTPKERLAGEAKRVVAIAAAALAVPEPAATTEAAWVPSITFAVAVLTMADLICAGCSEWLVCLTSAATP